MSLKIGRFKISAHNIDENPEMVRQIMGETIIVRCEHDYSTDMLNYNAICDQFEPCEQYAVIPEYEVINDGCTIMFKKIAK